MKNRFILLLFSFPIFLFGQDTFSIVAVDSLTGEVGSAGASCIANCHIISDVHPGVGAIHTQSYYLIANKNYAKSLMDSGYAPQAILDSVTANDAQADSSIRQYGAVDLVGGGRSAAFTGSGCFDYKNHLLGGTYAIQGNILLGQAILDSMESRFLNTPGPLCDKLMAAMQGANVPGADTRCLADGKPSISSFIRVAKPNDTLGTLFLDLKVTNTLTSQNPIDSLQVLFDQFKLQNSTRVPLQNRVKFIQQADECLIWLMPLQGETQVSLSLFDLSGKQMFSHYISSGEWHSLPVSGLSDGVYLITLSGNNFQPLSFRFLK